jgi:DMSO/TMAO reductase YedYZ molybdopterin-dependent catalytic subunit
LFMNKGLGLRMSLVAILSITVLVLSCSQLSPSSTPAPPPNTQELTPGQSIPSETQATPTSTDLSSLVRSDPAKVDNSKLPITPIEQIHITGSSPEIDIAKYRLVVDGRVDTPISLTYEAIMQYPTVTEVVLLICPYTFVDNAQWTGVPVATILAEVGVQPQASEVTFYAADQFQYNKTLPLVEAQHDGVFLAHTVDGQILPKEHGYPLRLVVKGEYGSYWVKWVNHIEIE